MRKRVVANSVLLGEVANLLAEGERVTLRCRGNSMLPFIVGGRDSVILERYGDCESCRVGDVVLAYLGDCQYVIHRVVVVDNINDEVILMGDGNEKAGERVRIDHVLGVVRGVVRGADSVDYQDVGVATFRWRVWNFLRPLRPLLLRFYYFFYRNNIDQI